ncbi:hypothetical protein MAE02_63290 [Microvirga aerophila]|uniref:Uncharacterized protein n=2 Tax=Microvirga aerophila TaxID=670291 RepID=A0A512C350_9HYPH|nr:hypothetical protein MAE02_63290 [Microvirga aerophila]
MTEDEIEAVARELAKIGGLSWYPGRTRGPLLRAVSERYRDRARVAIAALERLKAGKEGTVASQGSSFASPGTTTSQASEPGDCLQVGAVVVYRHPGDRRAIPCQITRMEEGRAYLVPCAQSDIGWVSLEHLVPPTAEPQRSQQDT